MIGNALAWHMTNPGLIQSVLPSTAGSSFLTAESGITSEHHGGSPKHYFPQRLIICGPRRDAFNFRILKIYFIVIFH